MQRHRSRASRPARELILDCIGGLNNNAIVNAKKTSTTASTAVWDAAGNNGTGTLTMNLAVGGGTAGTWTAADINTLRARPKPRVVQP